MEKQVHNFGVKLASRLFVNVFRDLFARPCFSINTIVGKFIPNIDDRKQPRCEFDPMEVVGIGASLAAESLLPTEGQKSS